MHPHQSCVRTKRDIAIQEVLRLTYLQTRQINHHSHQCYQYTVHTIFTQQNFINQDSKIFLQKNVAIVSRLKTFRTTLITGTLATRYGYILHPAALTNDKILHSYMLIPRKEQASILHKWKILQQLIYCYFYIRNIII